MFTSVRILIVAAMLAVPTIAFAGPIYPSGATWSLVNPANDGDEFWDNPSVDDATCGFICNAGGIAVLQATLAGAGPVEYLHDGSGNAVPFSFDDVVFPNLAASMTSWSGGTFQQLADGSFSYNANQAAHPEQVSNSLTNPNQFVLFRAAVGNGYMYWIGIEDVRLDLPVPMGIVADGDYNDYMVSFRQTNVPEPGLILLMGTGLFAAVRRYRGEGR